MQKRVLSMVLTVCLIVGAMHLPAFATDENTPNHILSGHCEMDAGFHWQECMRCGNVTAEEAHVMEESILTHPTKDEAGMRLRRCMVCSISEYVPIPRLDADGSEHTLPEPVIVTVERPDGIIYNVVGYSCGDTPEMLREHQRHYEALLQEGKLIASRINKPVGELDQEAHDEIFYSQALVYVGMNRMQAKLKLIHTEGPDDISGAHALDHVGYFTLSEHEAPYAPDILSGESVLDEDVLMVAFDNHDYYGEEKLFTMTALEDSQFFSVDLEHGDRTISYNNLIPGDLVKTNTFNGIYITSLDKTGNASYQEELQAYKNAIITSMLAYEMDHPEAFWLSGTIKIKATTVTRRGHSEVYFFLVLADSTGYSLLLPEFRTEHALEDAVRSMHAAVDEICSLITTDAGIKEQVAEINRWLVLNNEYNTLGHEGDIGELPHRSISALLGSIGEKGPVCDGYSRAFKVVADSLGIQCSLQTGYVKFNAVQGYHMWNLVMLEDEQWYAVDASWNDPVVKNASAPISGYENENYLLAAEDTVISGLAFKDTHFPQHIQNEGIELFDGLDLSKITLAEKPQFSDVPVSSWYYGDVRSLKSIGLMVGVGGGRFAPNARTTRAQALMVLYRLSEDSYDPGVNPFVDVTEDDWYYGAVLWAKERGITDGKSSTHFAPEDRITREELLTFIYRYAESKGEGTSYAKIHDFGDFESVSGYAKDAVVWAASKGILWGKTGNRIAPEDQLSRAELAAFISRLIKSEE